MPQYFSPGVYVEEVDAGPRPISGVSTSVTGAVGVTVRGPTSGKPQLVTSFNEFRQRFGGFLPEPEQSEKDPFLDKGHWWRFAHAVRGFFDNGGQQLYVKRVVAEDATPSAKEFVQGLYAPIVRDADIDATEITVGHVVGMRTEGEDTIDIINGQNGDEIAVGVTVTSYRSGATESKVTLAPGLAKAVKATRGDYVRIRPATADIRLKITASSVGKWGNDLRVQIRPSTSTLRILFKEDLDPEPGRGRLAADATDNADNTWTIVLKADPAHGLAEDDIVEIVGQKYELKNNAAADTFNIDRPAGAPALEADTVVLKRRKANDKNDTGTPSSKQLFVAGAGQLYPGAMIELDDGVKKVFRLVESVNGDIVSLNKAPGGDGDPATRITFVEGDSLHLIEAAVDVEFHVDGDVVSETFDNLKLRSPQDPEDPRLIGNHVSRRSALIQIKDVNLDNSDIARFPGGSHPTTLAGFEKLVTGTNKYAKLKDTDFIGDDLGSGKRTGIKSLEDREEISLVTVPGMWATSIIAELLRHCDAMKYRMAILDSPVNAKISPNSPSEPDIRQFRNAFDNKYAALYYPWIKVRQPGAEDDVVVPPSGHVAGIYANVDSRRGFHKAPANEVIKSITEINQDITRREQDLINPTGINALRFFPGRGNRVWGARTISSDTNFRYINVRRIFNFIEASIDNGTQFVVFEPNDATLWARVRQTVGNFLNTQWLNGVLEGSAAEEAYFVECDRGVTMSQDDIENGRLICEVGIAPVFPAEFVIFRIQKYTAESKLSG